VLALALTVSLGAVASADSVSAEHVRKYISVTSSDVSCTAAGTLTMYDFVETGYSEELYSNTHGADIFPSGVTFTIKNNHPTESMIVYYVEYKKQDEGAKVYYLDGDVVFCQDVGGDYLRRDYWTGYCLKDYTAEGATSAGKNLYWVEDRIFSDSNYEIKPGKSLTVSFDKSLISDDTVYQIRVQYYDEELDTYAYDGWYFFLEDSVSGFTDVGESTYYADAVTWAVDKGVTDGVSKTEFAPADTVTRAQAVTFLWRAYGKPEPTTTTSKFKDVKDTSAYYYKAVLWAAENGITTGVSDTWFDLNSSLTYDEILTFLCRAAGGDASGADWSEKAQTWAKTNGVSADLDFTAKGSCPRSDVVYCLYNQLAK
jgi:hypothetical protein